MPTVAAFEDIPGTDIPFLIPDPGGLNDRHFVNIDFPGVDPGEKSVLFFKIYPESTPFTFTVQINGSTVTTITITTDGTRTWHETIGANVLEETGNEVIVGQVGASGSFKIGDMVVLYKTNV